MDFGYTPKVEELRGRLGAFMDEHIVPRIRQWHEEVHAGRYPVSFMEELKARAKAEGLWNLFLPHLKAGEPGLGLTNLEYAPLAEIMGRVSWASEVFNCNAPDTGNMELLHMFATPVQREQWLLPLLRGEIRSAFAMTEPDVASSDATNITTRIERDGGDYVINGRKWFITNAAHPNCKIFIVMGKTDPAATSHQQQSMILVPRDTPGVTIVRNITGSITTRRKGTARSRSTTCACRRVTCSARKAAASRSRRRASGLAGSITACARSARRNWRWN